MSTPFTYRDLEAWKLGIDLVETCYKATGAFPQSELYGVTSQLRRASVSIPANVAEGQARKSTRAYKNHVSIAIGSHAEFTTCIEVATRLGFMSRAERDRFMALSDSVGRLLNGLHRALKRKLEARRRPKP
jgi:four helix bundle protein